MEEEKLKYDEKVIGIPLLIIFIIWFVYWLEIKFNYNFNKFGVYPHTLKGLRGILFSPFIHADTGHLFNNSVPLALFTASLFYFYREVALKVLLFGGLLTGLLTWSIARDNYHIGASGIVYLLFSFISFSGVFKKHFRLVAISLTIILFYGGMIWYVLPIEEGISWEGHLSGLISGIIFAYLFRKKGIVKQKYVFERTAFDEMFDENGNYVPPVVSSSEYYTSSTFQINGVTYDYVDKSTT